MFDSATRPTIAPRLVHAEPEYVPPSSLPSGPITPVPETMLPYYLTQGSDGFWYKVDQAWLMYGRGAAGDNDDTEISSFDSGATTSPAPTTSITMVPIASYAVVSVLPNGWGNTSKRGSLYQTPLIVAAAVIMAVLIVIGIIAIAIQRRRVTRRQKRHAARMRRKALAAAGLTEDEVRDGNEETQKAFNQRLNEVERMYQTKRRAKNGQPSTIVRTKVRVWRSGMRRRRPTKGGAQADADGAAKEDPSRVYMSSHLLRRQTRDSMSATDSTTSLASSFSSVDSDYRSHHHHQSQLPKSNRSPPTTVPVVEESDHRTDCTASDTLAQTTSTDPPLSPTSASSSHGASSSSPSGSGPSVYQQQRQQQQQPDASTSGGSSSSAIPHMPPAYRPASVHRSEAVAGPSTGPPPPSADAPLTATLSPEKVAAAGFYPAPATEGAEIAQAVAHRADAKAPIIAPPPTDEEHDNERQRRHIATDDKRELERLRLGASAPPVVRRAEAEAGSWPEAEAEAGPSAPSFDVDDSGFEVLSSGDAAAGSSSRSVQPPRLTLGIPAPPTMASQRSLQTFTGSSSSSPADMVPSAPPGRQDDDAALQVSSAPPLDDDDDGAPSAPPPLDATSAPSAPPHTPSAPPHEHELDESPVPSAPAFDDADSVYEHEHASGGGADGDDDDDDDDDDHEQHDGTAGTDAHHVRASLGVNGHQFLPRYEP